METRLECQASGFGTGRSEGGSETHPKGWVGSHWCLEKPKEGGAACWRDAELVHVMPNLSDPLQSDHKLIFFGWNEDLACFGGGEEMLWAVSAHRESWCSVYKCVWDMEGCRAGRAGPGDDPWCSNESWAGSWMRWTRGSGAWLRGSLQEQSKPRRLAFCSEKMIKA